MMITIEQCRELCAIVQQQGDIEISGDGWTLKQIVKLQPATAAPSPLPYTELVFDTTANIRPDCSWAWWSSSDANFIAFQMEQQINGRTWDDEAEKWVAA